jgi:hypothetical protein
MATQGIVSLVKNGAVALKCVAGCDGYNAPKVADWLRENPDADGRAVYRACIDVGFGCRDCLVVLTPNFHVAECENDLSPLYRKTFLDPRFNPRWDCGLAAHVEVVSV